MRAVSELPDFFHALDALLGTASDELYDLVTIGLLEDIVHEADNRGVKLRHSTARRGRRKEGVDRGREVLARRDAVAVRRRSGAATARDVTPRSDD